MDNHLKKTIIGYFTNWQELVSFLDDELILLDEQSNSVQFISANADEQNHLKDFLLQNSHPIAKNENSFVLENEISTQCSDYIFILNTNLSKEEYKKLYSQTNKKLFLLTDERLLINLSVIPNEEILEKIGAADDLTKMISNTSIFPFK